MDAVGVLEDGFARIKEVVHEAVEGLSKDDLAVQVDPEANSIAWLVWHLTRVQDDHVADVAERDQVWITGGWAERFGLPLDPYDTGFGHDAAQVAAVVADARSLRGYHDAVHRETIAYVRGLTAEDLDEVVDTSWDPPVTLAVRLVSVIADDLQHAGQAAYVKGLLQRR
ncbi:putative damage-inducible protein DinB [Actinocorallia herbida]|uniref:Putative damage-inducible protein DinB n=1 Tax=Actinocorallia herbida TaxID=58109 RepID=A0A3N1DAM1_9ACTN|nr:DUF664 domain-containing protein [Actinocorallia herbida]ROO90554.1 putative damage-inducible protein DinB [Actinocorallia herbida]